MRIAVTRIASALLSLYAIGTPAYTYPQKVELALQCHVSSVGATHLRITLRNTGSTDTAIVIGEWTGQRYAPNFLVLEVKRDSSSAVEEFQPDLGNIAGHVDPWIVALPAMSEFSFLQPISSYWSSSAPLRQLKFGDSAIDVRLRWIAATNPFGRDLANAFTGEAMSDWLRLRDQCRPA